MEPKSITVEDNLVTLVTHVDAETWREIEKFLREHPETGLSSAGFIWLACFLRVSEFHMQKEAAEPRL